MNDPLKSREELVQELSDLRQRVAELEDAERERDQLRQELDRLLMYRHTVKALEGERTRAHLYFQMAGVMLVVLDRDGNITRLNQKGHEILEYPDGELLGENWFQTCIPAAEREPLWSRFLQLMAGDLKSIAYGENLVVTRSGCERLMAWHNTLLRDDHGQPCGTLSSGTDITDLRRAEADRRRTEQALRQNHEELEQRVRERTAELLETNAQLSHEQEALRKLLAADDRERQLIAYDIHDGLTQFLVAASMNFEAYERRRTGDAEEAESAYEIGRRMLQEGISEVRRLSGNLRPPKIDERGVVAALAGYLQDTRYYGGIEVEFLHEVQFERLAPFLENAVVRLVQECVTNARRHSGSKKVRVQLIQRGDRLQLEIRDWGVGFSLAEVKPGSFGLEGIRARVRLLGGTVTIDSEPGTGTCILADLPVLLRQDHEATADDRP